MYNPIEKAKKLREKRLKILEDEEKYEEYCEKNRENPKK